MTGPQGPTGFAFEPSGIYVFSQNEQTILIGADVIFEGIAVFTPDFSFVPGTSDVISVTAAGIYSIDWSISTYQPVKAGVTRNDVLIPASTFGTNAGSTTLSTSCVAQISPGDIIKLQNSNSSANSIKLAVDLGGVTGGPPPNVSAHLKIIRIM